MWSVEPRSLVLHVGSDWEEFFYPSLVPWLHYVPVPAEADQQEILGLLHFLQVLVVHQCWCWRCCWYWWLCCWCWCWC